MSSVGDTYVLFTMFLLLLKSLHSLNIVDFFSSIDFLNLLIQLFHKNFYVVTDFHHFSFTFAQVIACYIQ